ncbi:TetR/AcrR family transcriptional regulator [Sphingobium sufflavum]|uniref:TetR/AcrR family transcriptional regulator n=1 Tax=Sphingobium sufflavum TaxID=1129547 RepID=UPI001F403E11|nr:TetR/AcrR family transcriptional regulator [Sphingobium sufflavum]MCE7795288.1 TetR/AcrR family transcriptional regulator [Sphingobium sufflavum]
MTNTPRQQAATTAPAGSTRLSRTRRGPGRPTRHQAVQRDMELLDCALDLFHQRGFEGTTIDAITAACNMAKRTIYARYADKTMLFKAALQRGIEEWVVPIERLQEAEDDDLEASLLRIGQILVANIVSPAGQRLMKITNAESSRMPEIGVYTLQQGTERTMAFLAELLRRRVRPDYAETHWAQDAAHAFIHLVVGGPATMRAWGVAVPDDEIERQTQFCVRLFLHGVLAKG